VGDDEEDESGGEVFMDEGTRPRRGNRRRIDEGRSMEVEELRDDDEGRRGGEKRTADQRSPNTEEERRNRQRLDEFEIGTRFGKISDTMKTEAKKIIEGMATVTEGDTEALKKWVTMGLKIMVTTVESTMTEMGDAVAADRKEREDMKKEMGDRMRRMEEMAKNNEVKIEAEIKARDTVRKRDSVRVMERKLEMANRQMKVMDIDYGKVITERREIVDKTLEYMRDAVNLRERKRFDILIKRTRIVVLGKETKAITVEGSRIYTVPILLEFRNMEDKVETEAILRSADYFGAYHWPMEIMGFVKTVRDEVRRMGYGDRHYIRIRPEERDGEMQIRADIKEKSGGRFWTVATWAVPPADVELRGSDAAKPKWQRPSSNR
jgi:hypothetical protein